jgi:hypothetical protein
MQGTCANFWSSLSAFFLDTWHSKCDLSSWLVWVSLDYQWLKGRDLFEWPLCWGFSQ